MSKASLHFTLNDMDGKHDAKEIKKELDVLPGVFSVSVSDSSKCVTVDFDITGVQSEHIKKRLEKMGYEILNSKTDKHIMQEPHK